MDRHKHHHFIKCLLLALAVAAPLTTHAAEGRNEGTLPLDRANEGTLPLRLRGNEGTLPLRFSGNAVDLAANQQVQATLLLTSVTQTALDDAQGIAVQCQTTGPSISKHAATGNLDVAGTSYAVRGICYDHDTRNMEVVAERGAAEQSFIVTRLITPEPRALQGRLTIRGGHAGRYQLDLTSSDPRPQ